MGCRADGGTLGSTSALVTAVKFVIRVEQNRTDNTDPLLSSGNDRANECKNVKLQEGCDVHEVVL